MSSGLIFFVYKAKSIKSKVESMTLLIKQEIQYLIYFKINIEFQNYAPFSLNVKTFNPEFTLLREYIECFRQYMALFHMCGFYVTKI